MTTLANRWMRDDAGELFLTAQSELQLNVWSSEHEDFVVAVPGLVFLRAGGEMECMMWCAKHGHIFPMEFLPPLPPNYHVVDGRIEKMGQELIPRQE